VATLVVTVPASIAQVRVIPARPTLALGTTTQFVAQVIDDRGRLVDDAPVDWSSSDAGVVYVSGNGLVTALGRGTATVRASVGAVSGSATLRVLSDAWQYSANLMHPPLLLRSDTTITGQHTRLFTESHLLGATFRYNSVTRTWSFVGEVVHSEVSDLQGNRIWRETGRETVQDHGVATDYDMFSGRIVMQSSLTSAVQFRFASAGENGSLVGVVRGYTATVQIPLQR
jgi:hypothetical protein